MSKRKTKVHEKAVRYRFNKLEEGFAYSNTNTKVFKLFGYFWTTNKNRKKMYKMDDWYWVREEMSLKDKVLSIFLGNCKRLKEDA